MTISARSARSGPKLTARALRVGVDDTVLMLFLEDGRSLTVPTVWFPRLAAATDEQRSNWKLVGNGVGIHWPDIDEDVSVENLLGAKGELLMDRAVTESPAPSDPLADRARRYEELLGQG
jgi:hypothetical protein